MAAKRHHRKQQFEAARRHPLSLVDNNKMYFINNTRYFNARRNYVKYIRSGLSAILEAVVVVLESWRSAWWSSNMWLSMMRYYVVTFLPPCLQTRWIGILLPLPCIPLLHPLLAGAQTFLVDCCVFHWWPSYQCLFYLMFNIFSPFDFTSSKSNRILLPACLPIVEPPLPPHLRCGHLLWVGCCVCCCQLVAV